MTLQNATQTPIGIEWCVTAAHYEGAEHTSDADCTIKTFTVDPDSSLVVDAFAVNGEYITTLAFDLGLTAI